jgi:hypothetical protein
MRPKTYALALAAMVGGCFAAVAGCNLYFDPEGVLGINSSPLVPNDRYLQFKAYQAAPDTYEALIFGSSRPSLGIPPDLLSGYVAGARVASFSVRAGTMTDHLPVLDYIVRTRRGHGKALRNVLLVLDVDIFGFTETNLSIQTLLAPEITGESPWRFKWRYLTAVQPQSWSATYRSRGIAAPPIAFGIGAASAAPAPAADDRVEQAQARTPAMDAPPGQPRFDPRSRPAFARELEMLRAFVAICRANQIDIVVAFSPLHKAVADGLDESAAADAVRRITAIVPVWDFGHPQWLSDAPELWSDMGHFTPAVGRMMLERIYADRPVAQHPDFGILRN